MSNWLNASYSYIKQYMYKMMLSPDNYILREYLDDFIIAYLDNIIIYLNDKEKYKEYIK
jgi:hypothetical protein